MSVVNEPVVPDVRDDAPHDDADAPASRHPWETALAVAVVLGAFALPLRGLLRYQGPPMEEGFMLAFPQEVLRGQIPNRDFLHLYGPGSLWVLAGVFKAFGTSLATERFAGLAQHVGVVFGIFFLARPWGRIVAVVAALVSLFIILPPVGLTAMAWNGAVAFGLWSLVVGLGAVRGEGVRVWGGGTDALRLLTADTDAQARRGADRRLLVAGLLAGVALLYRPDLIVAVTLGLGSLVWRQDRKARVRLLTGLGIGVVPYLLQFALAGPGHSIQGMVLDPVFRLRGGRTLPVPPPWDHLNGFLQKAAGLRNIGWPVPHLAVAHEAFLWFFLVPLSAFFVAGTGWWCHRRTPGSYRAQVLFTTGMFSVGILTQSLQRPDTAHFAWVSCVSVALVPVACAELASHVARRRGPVPAGAAFTVAALLLVGVMPLFTLRTYVDLSEQSFGRNVFGYPINNGGRNFYYGNADDAAAANQVVRALDRIQVPGKRLLVGPTDLRKTPYSDAFFYYLFPKLAVGTYYIEMDPGMANRPDSGLAHEVATSDYLILSDVWTNWVEPNTSRRFGPNAPNEEVAKHFCLVGAYGAGEAHPKGIFRLYRRCR